MIIYAVESGHIRALSLRQYAECDPVLAEERGVRFTTRPDVAVMWGLEQRQAMREVRG